MVRLCDQVPWHEASFRCLHLAFMRRSSLQTGYSSWRKSRYNPSELARNSRLDWSLGSGHVLKQLFVYPLTRLLRFDYKYRRYRKGPLREVDGRRFLPALCPSATDARPPVTPRVDGPPAGFEENPNEQ